MPSLNLTTIRRKELRAEAHHLDPVVYIGAEGLTPAVLNEASNALDSHGLIKIRAFADDRHARDALFVTLAEQLNAAAVQHIGKLFVLWRQPVVKEKEPNENRQPSPKTVKIVKFSKSGNHRPQVKKVKVLGNQRLAAGGELKRARKRVTSIKKTSAA